MTIRSNVIAAGVATASLLLSIAVRQSSDADAPEASSDGGPRPTLSVAPEELEVTAGLPCLAGPEFSVRLTNPGTEALYADSLLQAGEPLVMSRPMFSSYLPAGRTVSVPVTVTAPYGTEPGDYEITAELRFRRPRGETVQLPVRVLAPAPKAPGSNILLGEQATPSSTYVTGATEFSPCGAVDGDRTWSAPTAWSSAGSGEFPDTYTVTLPEPRPMNRVDLYTSRSASSTPERHGLRDWDVQVMTGGAWQTVAQVRGNSQLLVSSIFDTVTADAVRIVALAANDGTYARIAELEAYYDESS